MKSGLMHHAIEGETWMRRPTHIFARLWSCLGTNKAYPCIISPPTGINTRGTQNYQSFDHNTTTKVINRQKILAKSRKSRNAHNSNVPGSIPKVLLRLVHIEHSFCLRRWSNTLFVHFITSRMTIKFSSPFWISSRMVHVCVLWVASPY